MIPYITYRETVNGELRYYILQKAFPHYLAIVTEKPQISHFAQITIPGYNMFVVIEGTIRGRIIPNYQDALKEMDTIASNMAEWFLRERINLDPKRYKKWKYTAPSTTS